MERMFLVESPHGEKLDTFLSSSGFELATRVADLKDLSEKLFISMLETDAQHSLEAISNILRDLPEVVKDIPDAGLSDAELYKLEKLVLLLDNLEHILTEGAFVSVVMPDGTKDYAEQAQVEDMMTSTHATELRERFALAKPYFDSLKNKLGAIKVAHVET